MSPAATAARPPPGDRGRARPLRGRALARRWIVATVAGELAGFSVPAAVGAATTAAGVPPLLQAAMRVAAGACEGAVLGWAQSSPLAAALPRLQRRRWVRATAAAAAFAWAIGMIPATLGDRPAEVPLGVFGDRRERPRHTAARLDGDGAVVVLRHHVPRAGMASVDERRP